MIMTFLFFINIIYSYFVLPFYNFNSFLLFCRTPALVICKLFFVLNNYEKDADFDSCTFFNLFKPFFFIVLRHVAQLCYNICINILDNILYLSVNITHGYSRNIALKIIFNPFLTISLKVGYTMRCIYRRGGRELGRMLEKPCVDCLFFYFNKLLHTYFQTVTYYILIF